MDLSFNNKQLSLDANGITRNNLQGNCLVVPGQIEYFAMKNAPKGWFVCDGSSFDPHVYVDLSNAIGTRWGTSDNNYKLPDFRGCFLRNWSNDSTDHDVGRDLNTFQDSDIKEHNHTYLLNSHTHTNTEGGHHYNAHNHMIYWTVQWNHWGLYNGIEPGAYRHATALVGRALVGNSAHSHAEFGSYLNNDTITSSENSQPGLIDESRPENVSILVCIKY